MDGVLKIGTEIDDRNFEKDIENLENKIATAKKQQELLNSETSKYQTELNNINASIDESINKISQWSSQMSSLKQGRGSSVQYDANYNALDTNVSNEKAKLEGLLQKHGQISNSISQQEIKYQKINSQIDGYESKITKVKDKINELNAQKLSNINSHMENFSQKTENIINRVKRWGLSLFSVATIYSFVSRATSSAMSLNEGLSNAMTSVWNYFGELVTPILETLVSWVLKALAVVNRFLYTLTGIDFAARMNARALNKQAKATKQTAKAQKELNKQLADFDEITNLQDETSNNIDTTTPSTSSSAGTIELPELDPNTISIIDGIANAVKKVWEYTKPLRDIIVDIIDWCLKHPDVVLPVLGGLAIIKIIGKILGVSSATNPVGLLGIAAVLLTIANIEVYKKVGKELQNLDEDHKSVLKTQKSLVKQWESLPDSFEKCSNKAQVLSNQLNVLKNGVGNSTIAMAEHQHGISTNSEAMRENIKQLEAQKNALIEEYNQTDKNKTLTNDMITYLTNYKNALSKTNEKLGEGTNKGKENSAIIEENKTKISEADLQLKYLKYTLEGGTKSFEQYKKEVNNTNNKLGKVKDTMKELDGKTATVKIDADTSKAKSSTNNWFKEFANSALVNPINTLLKSIGLKMRVPKLARGGIVNNPGKGVNIGGAIAGEAGAEAVFPLENSRFIESFGDLIANKINGGMTNDLLLELISAVNTLAENPTVLNVNGQEIARATYQDFKNEENRINASANVRRY